MKDESVEAQAVRMFGVSFGYENTEQPENQIIPQRAELCEALKFYC